MLKNCPVGYNVISLPGNITTNIMSKIKYYTDEQVLEKLEAMGYEFDLEEDFSETAINEGFRWHEDRWTWDEDIQELEVIISRDEDNPRMLRLKASESTAYDYIHEDDPAGSLFDTLEAYANAGYKIVFS